MAIASEAGDQTVPAPCEAVSQVVAGGDPLLTCVADSTVMTVGATEVVLDSTSESESEGESDDEDVDEVSDSDVIPGGVSTPSLPSLQGRFICFSDYLPDNEMPDISFSNPANFWYMSG